jgi:SAM-dependent methyltransferase
MTRLTRPKRAAKGSDAAWARTLDAGLRLSHVAVLSGLGLLVELLLIRWLDAQVRPLAYVKNLALIGSFLGLGIGFALARSSRSLFPTAILLLAIALSVGSIFAALPERAVAGPGGPETNLGVDVAAGAGGLAAFYVLIVGIFALVVLAMVPLGQIAGVYMAGLPVLPAYSANVAGALGGVLVFCAMAALSIPPWVVAMLAFAIALAYLRSPIWFRIGSALLAGTAVAGMVLVDHRDTGATVWSPYNKIEVSLMKPAAAASNYTVSPAWELRVQNLYYQHVLDLRPQTRAAVAAAYPIARDAGYAYDYPYTWKHPKRVLVVGAGTGNDVAAALRNGAEEVVAVEIDPRIVGVGRRLHLEHPYDDPRVRLVEDDARAYLKTAGPAFDLIVFGLLDAHSSLFSTLSSNIRLDNYVYTVESLREALGRLTPDGALCLTIYVEQPWIASRIEAMLAEAGGTPPRTAPGLYSGHIFLAGPGLPPPGARPEMRVGLPPGEAAAHPPGPNATDDWPFLYLRDRVVPPTVGIASIGVLLIGGLIVMLLFRRRAGFDRHLFFLGAGFLLVETRTIAQLGLLFGTTWRVSAIAIGGILCLVLLANVAAARRPLSVRATLYAALGVLLLANYAVPPGIALGHGAPAIWAMTVFLLSPLFVAGLLFASALRERSDLATALASNLVGSVLGGLLENLSMVFGISALSLVALLVYAASFRR